MQDEEARDVFSFPGLSAAEPAVQPDWVSLRERSQLDHCYEWVEESATWEQNISLSLINIMCTETLLQLTATM